MRILVAAVALAGCAAGGSSRSEPIEQQPAEVFPTGAADCSDAPLTALEAVEAASGTRIAIDGVPSVGIGCTEKECTDGAACCNACGGAYALHDRSRFQINLHGLPGCSGMDCNTVCNPFGRYPTRSYRFVGTYDHAQRVLAVTKYCALAQDQR